MPEIRHRFLIRAGKEQVFEAVSTPEGLNSWWTATAEGTPIWGGTYLFGFGPEYDWRAVVVTRDDWVLEWEFAEALEDWVGTRVGFTLLEGDEGTEVHFWHVGWVEVTPHFCTTSFCWAMYLRLLKRLVEFGEVVPYEARLEA